MKKLKLHFKRLRSWFKYHALDITIIGLIIVLTLSYFNVMFWIDLGLLVIYLIFRIYIYYVQSKVSKYLGRNNVHVFGYRRSGKDLTLQNYVEKRYGKKYKKIIKKNNLKTEKEIYKYFKKHPLYLSLTNYGYGCKVVDIKEFELIDKKTGKYITYVDFINGNKVRAKKLKHYEGLDLILSEAQLSLPNTEHNILDKKYPWLPVFIALAGHLYNMNIIINSQEFNRPWVKLRNQQDLYIRSLKTIPYRKGFVARIVPYIPILRKYLITKIRIYEDKESAENNILPFNAKSIITDSTKDVIMSNAQATKEQFIATNGLIKEYWLFTKYEIIVYDSREYHKRIFGTNAPTH